MGGGGGEKGGGDFVPRLEHCRNECGKELRHAGLVHVVIGRASPNKIVIGTQNVRPHLQQHVSITATGNQQRCGCIRPHELLPVAPNRPFPFGPFVSLST